MIEKIFKFGLLKHLKFALLQCPILTEISVQFITTIEENLEIWSSETAHIDRNLLFTPSFFQIWSSETTQMNRNYVPGQESPFFSQDPQNEGIK